MAVVSFLVTIVFVVVGLRICGEISGDKSSSNTFILVSGCKVSKKERSGERGIPETRVGNTLNKECEVGCFSGFSRFARGFL